MKREEEFLIALVQTRGEFLHVQHNVRKAEAAIREAAQKGARLICFPEALLTGYRADRLPEACSLAEPEDRPNISLLQRQAEKYGVWLLLPFLEKRADGVFNSVILVNDYGQETGIYRKTHLTGKEKVCMTPGNRLSVWDTPFGMLGCLICYDICFPETARSLALAGAQLILVPSAWGAEKYYSNWWDLNIACRALDNLVYVAGINRTGPNGEKKFAGRSKVCDPVGTIIGQCSDDHEEILYVQIDPGRIGSERAENTVLDDLRPGLYSVARHVKETKR